MKAMSMRVINIVACLHAISSFGLKWRIEKVDGNRKRLLPVARHLGFIKEDKR